MEKTVTIENPEVDSLREITRLAMAALEPLPPHNGADVLAIGFNADGTVTIKLIVYLND